MPRNKTATIVGVALCLVAAFFGVVLVGWLSLGFAALEDVSTNGWYALLAGMLAVFTVLVIVGCIVIAIALFRFAKNNDAPEASLLSSGNSEFISGDGIIPDEIFVDVDEDVDASELVIAEDAQDVGVLSTTKDDKVDTWLTDELAAEVDAAAAEKPGPGYDTADDMITDLRNDKA